MEKYRPKMAGLLLGKGYQPPDPHIPDSDGLLSDGKARLPFVVAVDMDLKRIDRAYRAARETGYPKLALGALEPQAKIRSHLWQLDGKIVQDAYAKLRAHTAGKVKNSSFYVMVGLFNCIWEVQSDLLVDPYLNQLALPSRPGGGAPC